MSDYEAMRQEAVVREAIEEERQGEAEAWRLLFGDQGILEVADEIERLRNAYTAVLATGREERAEITRLRALNAELVEALEAIEALDWRDNCPECGGHDIPEICPLCLPKADAARLKRWDALAKAHGQTQAEWVAAMNAARAKADNGGET